MQRRRSTDSIKSPKASFDFLEEVHHEFKEPQPFKPFDRIPNRSTKLEATTSRRSNKTTNANNIFGIVQKKQTAPLPRKDDHVEPTKGGKDAGHKKVTTRQGRQSERDSDKASSTTSTNYQFFEDQLQKAPERKKTSSELDEESNDYNKTIPDSSEVNQGNLSQYNAVIIYIIIRSLKISLCLKL